MSPKRSPENKEKRLSKKQAASRSHRSSGGEFEGGKPHLNQINRRRKPRLALPLGELSPQATERVRQIIKPHGVPMVWSLFALSVFAALSHLSHRERQDCQKSSRLF